MEEQRADLNSELKWIFYNKKFMLILIVLVFFSSTFFFTLGFDLGVKKTIDSLLEVATNENTEGLIRWGCSALQGELIKP